MPGPFELFIILVIVVILFGVGKLPKVLGQMGKGVKAFKEGVQGNPNGDEDEDEAVDITPEDPPKAIDEKPPEAVEEAQEVVSADPQEEEDEQA